MSDAEHIKKLESLIPWAKAQAMQGMAYPEWSGATVPYRGTIIPLSGAGARATLQVIEELEND
jgi:hypothetical protein